MYTGRMKIGRRIRIDGDAGPGPTTLVRQMQPRTRVKDGPPHLVSETLIERCNLRHALLFLFAVVQLVECSENLLVHGQESDGRAADPGRFDVAVKDGSDGRTRVADIDDGRTRAARGVTGEDGFFGEKDGGRVGGFKETLDRPLTKRRWIVGAFAQ